MKRRGRWLTRGALALLLVTLALLGWAWWLLRGSLPTLEGELALPGLSAPVQVQRDAQGVVTIRAANALDAARALGFVHGQERFFEMDLLRRSAAGELSELFGQIAVEKDKSARVHRLRARTEANLAAVAGARMPQLVAYTDGVNAGLASLHRKPWPYLLLRVQPRDWRPADTALAGYAMFFDLQDESNSRELALWKIRELVPPALYRLIAADGTEWDAPLLGPARGNVRLPTKAELDLRRLPMPDTPVQGGEAEPAAPGSNNFAVAGALTVDGRAIVANDMHLSLRAPDIWFRARLQYADAAAPGHRVDVSGFTLPGIPAVVVGSNGHVAWGFTNSYGDWLDFYRVHWSDASRERYRTAGGDLPLTVYDEHIHVKGAPDVVLQVRETTWGPITVQLGQGDALALRWTAHRPGSINLGLAEMPNARDLDDALRIAGGIGMPAQNMLIADAHGRIAWRLTTRMPNRVGDCDITAPVDAALGCGWSGWRGPAQNPAVVDPPNGRLWTANARTVDGEALSLLGDSGYALGARAKQIRDDLYSKPRFGERDLLAIQLDDRALFLQRWWKLMRAQAAASRTPAWGDIEVATRRWDGRASPESVSYRITREWRKAVLARIRAGLMAPAMAALGKDFDMPDLPQLEGVAWQLVTQRPMHLLPRAYASWDELLLDAARDVDNQLLETGPLPERSWGERNRAAICHPLARALPGFTRRWICMPPDPLPGDEAMPRIASPTFGASERMVVSPGHEADGIIEMPGGQSGHPLSPYWGAGHQAWVRGEASPFLPGATQYTLVLKAAPAR
jgi:penicillin amidase